MFFKSQERIDDALMKRIERLERQYKELYDMTQIPVYRDTNFGYIGYVDGWTEISVREVVRRLVDVAGLELKYVEAAPRRAEIIKKPRKR